MTRNLITAVVAVLCVPCAFTAAADIYVGSGAKVGEMTDRAAIVLLRLTSTPGQDKGGLIPGCEGEARLLYGTDQTLTSPQTTAWQSADPNADWSIRFALTDLRPGTRYYYRAEYRAKGES